MRYRYQVGETLHEVTLERNGDRYQAVIDGLAYELEILNEQPGVLSLRFEGKPVRLYWAANAGTKWVSMEGCTYRLEKPLPRAARQAAQGAAGGQVRSPMPAQVLSVEVFEGENVEQGQTLLLLEAMKMEIQIRAPLAGRVARLTVQSGQPVERDELLAEISEPAQDQEAG